MKYFKKDFMYSILMLIPLMGPMLGFVIIMFKYEYKSSFPSKKFIIAASLPAVIFTIYFLILLIIYRGFDWSLSGLFYWFLFIPPTILFDYMLVRFYIKTIQSLK